MKNRRYALVSVGLCFLVALGVLVMGTSKRLRAKQQTAQRRQNFQGIHADTGGRIARLRLNGETPTVIVYFHPDCEHCQYEAQQLSHHPSLLQKARVWFLSTEPAPALKTFSHRYRLDALSGVTVARIEPSLAFDSLGFRGVPHLLVYAPDGKLKKEFRGETRWETVEKAL